MKTAILILLVGNLPLNFTVAQEASESLSRTGSANITGGLTTPVKPFGLTMDSRVGHNASPPPPLPTEL